MEESELKELNSAIARYLPDRQLITFSAGMMILPREESGESGFADIRQIAYFFHEWIHYLHNISTLHGISAFVALAELWSAFRRTTNSFGIGSGEIDHANPKLFQVPALVAMRRAARKNSTVPIPKDIVPENVTVISFSEEGAVDGRNAAYLRLSVYLANKAGDQTRATIELGPGEILESVAFLLEKRFLDRLAQLEVSQSSVVPYHVLTIFARHVAPSLSEEAILLCGLASLQSTSPSSELVSLLNGCEAIEPVDSKRRQYLTDIVIHRMMSRESEYLEWLNRLDVMFPNSESMGLAVKETVGYMRRNLEIRKARPFFELEFIDEMRSAGAERFHALMDELMVDHGICAGLQEHFGSGDEIGRDIMFDFAVVGGDTELNAGRRIMQASFEFVLRHFSVRGDFVSTEKAGRGPCPFYTSCTESTRTDKPDQCKTEPWKAVHSYPHSVCWYGGGVLNVRPGGT